MKITTSLSIMGQAEVNLRSYKQASLTKSESIEKLRACSEPTLASNINCNFSKIISTRRAKTSSESLGGVGVAYP